MSFSSSGTRDTIQASNYQQGNKSASSYETLSGLLVLPLAEQSGSTGAPVEFVRVHQPIRRRIYDFAAVKSKTPPLIPAPDDNAKEYLIHSRMDFPLPSIAADRSSLVWQASGRMEFVEKGYFTAATGYRIAQYPVLNTPESLAGLAAVVGGVAIVAAETDTYGETLANNLTGFPSEPSYANQAYDYAPHFPSRFLVSDLSLGN